MVIAKIYSSRGSWLLVSNPPDVKCSVLLALLALMALLAMSTVRLSPNPMLPAGPLGWRTTPAAEDAEEMEAEGSTR